MYETGSNRALTFEKTYRDHGGIEDGKEKSEIALKDGAFLLRTSDKGTLQGFGKANKTVTEYRARAADGASFSDSFTVRDEKSKMTFRYRVELRQRRILLYRCAPLERIHCRRLSAGNQGDGAGTEKRR